MSIDNNIFTGGCQFQFPFQWCNAKMTHTRTDDKNRFCATFAPETLIGRQSSRYTLIVSNILLHILLFIIDQIAKVSELNKNIYNFKRINFRTRYEVPTGNYANRFFFECVKINDNLWEFFPSSMYQIEFNINTSQNSN